MADQLEWYQVEEFRRAFDTFDTDKDGSITVKELGEVLKSMGQFLSVQQLRQMISEVDVDGSGSIEFGEFLSLMARTLKETDTEEQLYQAFRKYDNDGDGSITIVEFKRQLEEYGEVVTEEQIKEMLSNADVDGDGCINFEEFKRIILGR